MGYCKLLLEIVKKYENHSHRLRRTSVVDSVATNLQAKYQAAKWIFD